MTDELGPEQATMCSAIEGEQKHMPAHREDETFGLELAFARAHGTNHGEITTLSCAGRIVHHRNRPGRSHLSSQGADQA